MSTHYQSLYRKYRPASFSGIIGQRHVTQTLANAVESGRVSHAYLFCGPRGTGKTTTARALAMALNCEKGPGAEPCGNCGVCLEIKRGACLDVVEFDAASHRGVEDMEELRRRFQFAPGQTRFKVYIIDEVHQLSDQAFDMLLKVLEEPPAKVVFVLATTEPHKVKPTILSRCQRFDFHRISTSEIQQRLRQVCEKEGLKSEEKALSLLAYAADGSARDALSLLEQAAAFATSAITVAEVRALLGGIEPELLIEFTETFAQRRVEAAFTLIDRVVAEGKDLVQLLRELMKYLRDLLVIRIADRGRQEDLASVELALPEEYLPRSRQQAKAFSEAHLLALIDLLCEAEGDLRLSGQPRLILELCAARACGLAEAQAIPSAKPVPAAVSQQTPAAEKRPALQPPSPGAASPKETDVPAGDLEEIRKKWPEVLETLKKEKQAALRTIAEDAAPLRLEGDLLTLAFTYEFNHAEMSKQERKTLLEKALARVMGRPLRIDCKLRGELEQPPPTEGASLLSEALDLFPGSELL